MAEIYFSMAISMFEPELATCRAVYTKYAICVVILERRVVTVQSRSQSELLLNHLVCMQPRLTWAPLGSRSVACLRRRRMVGGRDDEVIEEEDCGRS